MKKMLLAILAGLLLVTVPFWGALVYGKIENRVICREVTNYVIENRDSIVVIDDHQSFVYKTTGMVSAGVEYGYYFDAENEFAMKGIPYRNGIRVDGYPDDRTDWFYTKRICENWFYYEVHDG
jgi:hypothetical protein